MERSEYLASSEYKTVLVLSKFNLLSSLVPMQVVMVIKGYKKAPNEDFNNHFCQNYLSLIHSGDEQLTIEEIENYANAIAIYYGFNCKSFFNSVKYHANCLDITYDDARKDNRKILKAIAKISSEM
ncbi:MAG: hypothetical protein IKI57_03035 [Clostridia bacterium]|nr:hypothetical protein [Clostridia bacterium]